MPTVNFSEDKFQPSFGYMEAQVACENLNKKKYGWNVRFDFNRGCSFSTDYPIGYFDFYAAIATELKNYLSSYTAQTGAMAFAISSDIHLGAGQESAIGHEAWHVMQQ